MINKILFGAGMLAVTLAIHFVLYKKGKGITFFSGTGVVFIMCILGLLANDADYFAGIIGYVLGDAIGKFAGWHKYDEKNSSNTKF